MFKSKVITGYPADDNATLYLPAYQDADGAVTTTKVNAIGYVLALGHASCATIRRG